MNPKNIIVLNPDYHFRNDLNRILMYSKNNVKEYSSNRWTNIIHPMQAVILSLFTIPRPLKEQLELLSQKFNISIDKAEELIAPYINNEESFHTEFLSSKIFFPKNVLIDSSKVSLDSLSYDFNAEDLKCDSIDLNFDRIHKAPLRMLFMMTNKCVTACKYCYANKQTAYKELTTERILELVHEASTLKMDYIDVIGGEIFCKKDWNIIIKALVEANLTPNFISTKVPITEHIAQLLSETGYNNVVQISLDSLKDDILTQTIGVKIEYIEKIKKGIELLCKYGFKVQIDTILTKYNVFEDEISALYEYIKTINNLVYWEIRVPMPSIYNRKTFHEIEADKSSLQNIITFIKENIQPTSNINIIISDRELIDTFREGKRTDKNFRDGKCSVLQHNLFILPDGKVSLCEQLYWHPRFIIGDLRTQSIEEIWQSEKAKSMYVWHKDFYKNSNSKCVTCSIFDFCHQNHRKCWYRVLQAYGVEHWDYPDPRCEFAP